jgi:hypothetical protein
MVARARYRVAAPDDFFPVTALTRITALATATPDHDIHGAFVGWARGRLTDPREAAVFERMAGRAAATGRWRVACR